MVGKAKSRRSRGSNLIQKNLDLFLFFFYRSVLGNIAVLLKWSKVFLITDFCNFQMLFLCRDNTCHDPLPIMASLTHEDLKSESSEEESQPGTSGTSQSHKVDICVARAGIFPPFRRNRHFGQPFTQPSAYWAGMNDGNLFLSLNTKMNELGQKCNLTLLNFVCYFRSCTDPVDINIITGMITYYFKYIEVRNTRYI